MRGYTTDIKLPYCNVCGMYIKLEGGETAKNAVDRHIKAGRHRARVGPRPRSVGSFERAEIRGNLVLPAWLRKGVKR